MRTISYSLVSIIVVAGIFVVYNFYNPPRPKMILLVPVHALERMGYNDGDLSFMLSDNNSCKNRFGKHNYTVMFNHEGNWKDVRVWSQHVTLYLTWREIWQITDEIYLCIQFKNEREAVWRGNFSLKGTLDLYVAYNSFFCSKRRKGSSIILTGSVNPNYTPSMARPPFLRLSWACETQ